MKLEQILNPRNCVGLKFVGFIEGHSQFSIILFEEGQCLVVKAYPDGDITDAPEVITTRVDVLSQLYRADIQKYGLE